MTMRTPRPTSASQATDVTTAETTRLHVSPFSPGLLPTVIPENVLPLARNISFHTLETFPERRYGFVDLPTAEAEKLRRRLNSAVLKGRKMRVERARPENVPAPSGGEGREDGKKNKKRRERIGDAALEGGTSKRRKRTDGVYDGVDLGDRKVKSLWTVAEDPEKKKHKKDRKSSSGGGGMDDDGKNEKKDRPKSKYSDRPEHLLRVKLPPNAPAPTHGKSGSKKDKSRRGREMFVHEFERTKKFPTFLKAANAAPGDANPAVEFVDGRGWVDADGNLVQAVKTRSATGRARSSERIPTGAAAEGGDDDGDDETETSSSGTSSSGSDSDEDEDDAQDPSPAQQRQQRAAARDAPGKIVPPSPTPSGRADATRPMSAGSARSLSIKIPPPSTPLGVHPLEALYKKKPADATAGTAGTPATVTSQPFAFFDAEPEDAEAPAHVQSTVEHGTPGFAAASGPMTPFTRQEFEWRRVRSAAPTPDTAHPTRTKTFFSGEDPEMEGDEDGSEGDMNVDAPETSEAGGGNRCEGAGAPSDFQAWFWENRADLNRSWMKRRKMAGKEKRQRENKARTRRG